MIRKFIALIALASILAAPAAHAVPPSSAAPVQYVGTGAPASVNMAGDSLTALNLDNSYITIPSALTPLLNMQVVNEGIGSQKTTQICMRLGACPVILTFSGNQITHFANTVTALNGVAIQPMATTNDPDYRFLSVIQDGTTRNLTGWVTNCTRGGVNKPVHGVLIGTGSGGPPSTSTTYLFTPDAPYNIDLGSVPASCPTSASFVSDLVGQLSQPTIIEDGTNNIYAQSQVLADDATMVAALKAAGSPGWLVLDALNGETAPSGTSVYNETVAVNAAKASANPGHYVPWRAWLVSQANLSDPLDAYDHTNDIPPASLRAIDGRGTLNGAVSSTSATTINVTTTFQATTVGVMKVDSEYMKVTGTGSGTVIVTRGYAGTTPATHASGAAWVIIDDLHPGWNGAIATAAWLAANYKTALLGNLPNQAVTGSSLAATLAGPLSLPGVVTFENYTYFKNQVVLAGGGIAQGACLEASQNGVAPIDWPYNGNISNLICLQSGQLFLGGAWNTTIPVFNNNSIRAGWDINNAFYNTGAIRDEAYGTIQTPTTGQTVTFANTQDRMIVAPAGGLAALTVQLGTCAAAFDGQQNAVTITQAVTTLTTTATAGTVTGAPASAAAYVPQAYMCVGATSTWQRLQ